MTPKVEENKQEVKFNSDEQGSGFLPSGLFLFLFVILKSLSVTTQYYLLVVDDVYEIIGGFRTECNDGVWTKKVLLTVFLLLPRPPSSDFLF
jgi:hypothetical protein